MKRKNYLYIILGVLLLAACGGDGDGLPTAVVPASTAVPLTTDALPPTNDITTTQPPAASNGTPTPAAPDIEAGGVIGDGVVGDDDFLPIDTILDEIDNVVCQDAYETLDELEALIEAGEDVAELKTAVEELIAELENCPTPTPSF